MIREHSDEAESMGDPEHVEHPGSERVGRDPGISRSYRVWGSAFLSALVHLRGGESFGR
jgi:hypothetical protein